ncbi:MAG: hypothetical protein JSW62_04165 [Thermoplasmatales archaeon]|nr:MAG: hypothetical protein JSW62_04165 [Thermoplasmatales archaeon]
MKKSNYVFVGIVIATMILSSLTTSTFANENGSINNNEPSLDVTVEITGGGRTYTIKTYLINNGLETVTVWTTQWPYGGCSISDQNGKMVYDYPDGGFDVVTEWTLKPDQTEEMNRLRWNGIDDEGNKLPSGDYSVKGVVFTGTPYTVTEKIIHLPKAKISYIFEFLKHFPLLEKIIFQFLSIFN